MKKISIFSLSVLVLLGTGCMKDKGFDNQEYGINYPGSVSANGIGFNGASVKTVGVDAASSNPQAVDASYTTVALFSGTTTATKDINVHLELDPTILSEYNASLPTGTSPVLLLDPSVYTIQTLDITIPSGSQNIPINISINSTTSLNPLETYAIPMRIVSTDAGYTIASNMSTRLLKVSLKNAYDGVYQDDFYNVHPSYNPAGDGGTAEVEMQTTGPNSVKLYWPDAGSYSNPSILNGSLTAFSLQEPEYTIDPSTFQVTVANVAVGGTSVYSMYPGFNSYYDPATRTIYAKWGYSSFTRYWEQTFTYLRPR